MKLRKRSIILAAIALVLTAVFLVCHIWFHVLAAKYLSSRLGAPVNIDFAHLNVLNSHAELRGVRILNPKPFPKGVLAVISKIEIDMDADKLLKGKIHFHFVDVDMKELRILKTKDQGFNIVALKPFREQVEYVSKDTVDQLVLSLGKAIVTDLTQSRPVQRVFDMNQAGVIYSNVGGINDSLKLISWQILSSIKYEPLSAIMARLKKELGEYTREDSKSFFGEVVERIKEDL